VAYVLLLGHRAQGGAKKYTTTKLSKNCVKSY